MLTAYAKMWLEIPSTDNHTLKNRVEVLEIRFQACNDDQYACCAVVREHTVASLRRVLDDLTRVYASDRSATVPDAFMALYIAFVNAVYNFCAFTAEFSTKTLTLQLLHHDKLAERLHTVHENVETFVRGVQELRANNDLPASFATFDLAPSESPRVRSYWRALVDNGCLSQIASPEALKTIRQTLDDFARCTFQCELRRMRRLGLENAALRSMRRLLTPLRSPLSDVLHRDFIPSSDLVLTSQMGDGGYGVAHLATLRDTTHVIVKSLYVEHFDEMALQREVAIWRDLRHPHVLQFYGVTPAMIKPTIGPSVRTWGLVSKFASKKTLKNYLAAHAAALRLKSSAAGDKTPDKLTRSDAPVHALERTRLLLEAALGLTYLHASGVVHADLRCENILVGSDGHAKVADFGLSFRVRGNVGPFDMDVKRTEAYDWVAPECLDPKQQRSTATDVFMFGRTILEACTGIKPYDNSNNPSVKYFVKKGKQPPLLDTLEAEDLALVVDMCKPEPSERITMDDVVTRLQERMQHHERRCRDDERDNVVVGATVP